MCSFYRDFCITGAQDVARLTALVAAHCNSKDPSKAAMNNCEF